MAESRVVFHYPRTLIDAPIVSRIVREFDLDFNILRADITPDAEGLLVLELCGDAARIDRALEWAAMQGVRIEALEMDVTRNDDACTQCGACVIMCPTDALRKDRVTQEVQFNPEECVACELCVRACPPRAMAVTF